MSLRCNPSTHVNQVHDTAAEEVPERVGIIWQGNIVYSDRDSRTGRPFRTEEFMLASSYLGALAAAGGVGRYAAGGELDDLACDLFLAQAAEAADQLL